jgi:hypothetical protein
VGVCLLAQRYRDVPEMGDTNAPFLSKSLERLGFQAVECLRKSNEFELRVPGVFVSLSVALPVFAEATQRPVLLLQSTLSPSELAQLVSLMNWSSPRRLEVTQGVGWLL